MVKRSELVFSDGGKEGCFDITCEVSAADHRAWTATFPPERGDSEQNTSRLVLAVEHRIMKSSFGEVLKVVLPHVCSC